MTRTTGGIRESVTIGGLIYTSTGVTTQAQLIAGFTSLDVGATTGGATATGAYTGALAGFSSGTNSAGVITFTSTTPNTPVTSLTETDVSNAINPLVTTDGRIAIPGVAEVAVVSFSALLSGKTVSLNGVTVTAPAGGLTAEGVASLFANRASGDATDDILTGTDTVDQTGSLSGAVVTLTAGAAGTQNDLTVTATGIAAFSVTTQGAAGSGSGTTNYAENLTAVATIDDLLTAADLALNSTVDFYFGVVGVNGYLVQDDNGTGHTNLIKLSGVTDMDYSDIVGSSA